MSDLKTKLICPSKKQLHSAIASAFKICEEISMRAVKFTTNFI